MFAKGAESGHRQRDMAIHGRAKAGGLAPATTEGTVKDVTADLVHTLHRAGPTRIDVSRVVMR